MCLDSTSIKDDKDSHERTALQEGLSDMILKASPVSVCSVFGYVRPTDLFVHLRTGQECPKSAQVCTFAERLCRQESHGFHNDAIYTLCLWRDKKGMSLCDNGA